MDIATFNLCGMDSAGIACICRLWEVLWEACRLFCRVTQRSARPKQKTDKEENKQQPVAILAQGHWCRARKNRYLPPISLFAFHSPPAQGSAEERPTLHVAKPPVSLQVVQRCTTCPPAPVSRKARLLSLPMSLDGNEKVLDQPRASGPQKRPTRKLCDRCGHRPNRRVPCRICKRAVGPCCLETEKPTPLCKDCWEPDPEPDPVAKANFYQGREPRVMRSRSRRRRMVKPGRLVQNGKRKQENRKMQKTPRHKDRP